MNQHRTSKRRDGLTILLFRLPAELRLQIYEYLTPEPSVLLVPESNSWNWDLGTPGKSNRRSFRWLDISREVFLDAGPLFYGTKPLYFWIDARNNNRGRSLDDALRHHIRSAHPENAKWACDVVRSSMLSKLMLEVHAPSRGENFECVLLRFADMASQLRKYTALEQLHISLRPHYNNAHHQLLFRSFKTVRLQEKTVKESWTMRRLCRAARQIKAQLPPNCNVKWYLPGKTLRKVPYKRRDLPDSEEPFQVMDKELNVIEFMEALWTFVCGRSDKELDDLLSEEEPQSAWGIRQSR